MSKSPCKNCPDRAINCHSGCPKYQEFANGREVIRKERRERVDTLYGMNAVRDSKIQIAYFKCHKK
jgi:hypothetical protein